MDEGFVYILSNRSMPSLLKIGYTRKVVDERISELSSVTGIPTPFVAEYYVFTERPDYWESRLHDELSRYRENDSREFFKVDIAIAAECFDRLVQPKKHVFSRQAHEKKIEALREKQDETMRREQAQRVKDLKEQEQAKERTAYDEQLRKQKESATNQYVADVLRQQSEKDSYRLTGWIMLPASLAILFVGAAGNAGFMIGIGLLGLLLSSVYIWWAKK